MTFFSFFFFNVSQMRGKKLRAYLDYNLFFLKNHVTTVFCSLNIQTSPQGINFKNYDWFSKVNIHKINWFLWHSLEMRPWRQIDGNSGAHHRRLWQRWRRNLSNNRSSMKPFSSCEKFAAKHWGVRSEHYWKQVGPNWQW